MFMLIMLLQGIWLLLHGYSYESTPFWAGIYMLPLTIGVIIMGPISGWLSDKYGPRWIATGDGNKHSFIPSACITSI